MLINKELKRGRQGRKGEREKKKEVQKSEFKKIT